MSKISTKPVTICTPKCFPPDADPKKDPMAGIYSLIRWYPTERGYEAGLVLCGAVDVTALYPKGKKVPQFMLDHQNKLGGLYEVIQSSAEDLGKKHRLTVGKGVLYEIQPEAFADHGFEGPPNGPLVREADNEEESP